MGAGERRPWEDMETHVVWANAGRPEFHLALTHALKTDILSVWLK